MTSSILSRTYPALAGGVVRCDIAVDFLEVARSVFDEEDLEAYQPRALLPRRRLTACDAGTTLPSPICRVPRARILSSAIVSCVSS